MQENIYLYYTSDLHSHFENWPKIVHFLKTKIKNHEQNNETYFIFDNGDHVDRFHPITEATLGAENIRLLNLAGYNCVNLGNNEGITLTKDTLYHLYDKADFEVVCSNITTIEKNEPKWLKSYSVLTTKKGVRIGVIGLTAPFKTFYQEYGWDALDPMSLLEHLLPDIKHECDVIVLLSHLGINDDEEITRRFPEVDVIIGGHTHHHFKEGHVLNNTLLTATGKHGKNVGVIQLKLDLNNKKIVSKKAHTISTEPLLEDTETKQALIEANNRAETILNKEVSFLAEKLKSDWYKETEVMKKLTATLREWTEADCAMLNSGIILEDIPKGTVTLGDLHQICPHPMNPCVVELTGEELLEVIRLVHTKRFIDIGLKGFGFRGEVIGRMVFDNLEVNTVLDSDGVEHVRNVFLYGKRINPREIYRLATADTFTFGNLIPEISRATVKEYFMPEFLRDLLKVSLKS